MRFIKIQDTIINLAQVEAVYARDSTCSLHVYMVGRDLLFQYTSPEDAAMTLSCIIRKLEEYSGCYVGEIK